jgi:hypothetical protein
MLMLRIVSGRPPGSTSVAAIDGYQPTRSWVCLDEAELPAVDPDAEVVTDQYGVDGHVVRTVWRRRAGPDGPGAGSCELHGPPQRCVPVGASEIGRMLGRPATTVQTWWARTRRGELPVPMPNPIGTVSGRPAWCRAMVQAWARRTNRLADRSE